MDPLQDPVPGSSAKKSDSEDDIPLAAVRERKDAKGKVKKSSNIDAKKVPKGKSGSSDVIESKVGNVDKEKKVPKGKVGNLDKEKKVPKGKVGNVDKEKKVPKGKVGNVDKDEKKVPKGKPASSANVAEASVNVASGNVVSNSDEDEEEGGGLELTAAEATQGWSLTKKRRILKVR